MRCYRVELYDGAQYFTVTVTADDYYQARRLVECQYRGCRVTDVQEQ